MRAKREDGMRYLFLAAKLTFVVVLAWTADRDARQARAIDAHCTERGFARDSVDFTLCRVELIDRRRRLENTD